MNRFELLERTYSEYVSEIPFSNIVKSDWFNDDLPIEVAEEQVAEAATQVKNDLTKLDDLFDEPLERRVAREVYKNEPNLENLVKLVSRYSNGRKAILNVVRTKEIRAKLGEDIIKLAIVGSVEKLLLLIQLLSSNSFRYQIL